MYVRSPSLLYELRRQLVHHEGVRRGQVDAVHLPAQRLWARNPRVHTLRQVSDVLQ
jgi:hypothetical protein